MRERWKSIAPGLRVALTVIVASVLVSRLHLADVFSPTRGPTIPLLMVALVVTVGGVGLSVLRWHRVLVAMGLPTRVWTLVRLHLAGLFVGTFLPSTVGGDVVRASRLGRITHQRAGATASVVLERLTGWIVLPVLTLSALVVNPALLDLGQASHLALTVALITLVALAVILVAASNRRIGRALARRRGSWARTMAAVTDGLDQLRRQPLAAAQVLVVSFAYQLVVALAAFLVGRSMGLDLSWTAAMAFMPVVAIVQVLPLTIGGLGLREGAFILLLRPLGVTTSQAIAFGLLVYALNLVVGLLGAPAYAVDERPPVEVPSDLPAA